MVIRGDQDNLDDQGRWCLALSRIRPSLDDLHQAIRSRDLKKVRLLCSYTPLNTDSSLRSVTALSLAVQQGDPQIVTVLLEHGANANKLSCDWNGRLETPLLIVCRQANYETAKILIDYGADVNAADFNMHTPLWIATRDRALALVNLLIENGANLNVGDKRNPCPLYLATKYLGRSEIAKSLIRHGCKLDVTDLEKRGAVYWTFYNNLIDVFKMLIYAGAHINRKDRDFMIKNKNLLRQNDQLNEWIQIEIRNPPTLTRLTANTIRHRLNESNAGKSIWTKIDKLPIPNHLKNNLKMINFS